MASRAVSLMSSQEVATAAQAQHTSLFQIFNTLQPAGYPALTGLPAWMMPAQHNNALTSSGRLESGTTNANENPAALGL
jgi:hypothetical protein